MCGICGAIDFSGASSAAEVVRLMTPTMRHRGPDDDGIADFGLRNADSDQSDNTRVGQDGRCGSFAMGMRRLSIIDIEGGHQPIFNDDRTVGVILNGEIYNFQELQKQLAERGHKFHTRSDSEVVVRAYEEWGAQCVERLQGMFAIAVWDGRAKGVQFRVPSSEFRVQTKNEVLTNSEPGTRNSKRASPELETRNSELETRTEGTLFLARDRMGIKPLYYYAPGFRVPSSEFRVKTRNDFLTNSELETRNSKLGSSELGTRNSKLETFLFASEVRTLLASGLVPRKLSRDAVESYLLFGSVSEPLTLIEDVMSLPPGHCMTIDLGGGGVKVERYWAIGEVSSSEFRVSSSNGRAGASPLPDHETTCEVPSSEFRVSSSNGKAGAGPRPDRESKSEAARRVRALLEQSVRGHLIADVPVGVFLSSGIDSTALAALASREVSGVHTFTVAFPEGEFSEAAIARRTAKTFGTTHSEVMLSGDEMLARLDEAVGALDQPTMDGINTYFVSASARAVGLKVALSGLGGDEVFGGYNSFRRTPQYQRMARAGEFMPAGVRSAMAAAMSGTAGRLMSGDASRKLSSLWKDSEALPDPYYFNRLLFTPPQVASLIRGEVGAPSPWRDWLTVSSQRARKLDSFAAVSCLEVESYLVNTLLRDTDSMSMAHSLEVRVPFLDHPLVEYVTHLPQQVKIADGRPKALLVAAMAELLPDEVVNQPKRGFTFPWSEWLRGPLKQEIESGLSELAPALAEIVDAKAARGVWRDYLDGKTSWSRPWALFVLNQWVKKHL